MDTPVVPQSHLGHHASPRHHDSVTRASLFLLIGLVVAGFFVSGFFGYFMGKQNSFANNKSVKVSAAVENHSGTVPKPVNTENLPALTGVDGWTVFVDNTMTLLYPSHWIAGKVMIHGSSSEIEFTDPRKMYAFTISRRMNYDQATGKQFDSLEQYLNMSYTPRKVLVSGREALQPLPRAGSENRNLAYLFTSGTKVITSIELTSLKPDETSVLQGQALFAKIINNAVLTD